jgi:hypothetical protein
LRVVISFFVSRFHNLMVLSVLAEARVFPSGLKLTLMTQLLCPLRVVISFFVSRFHSLMVLSVLAEARVFPSGLKVTLMTSLLWPLRVVISALHNGGMN